LINTPYTHQYVPVISIAGSDSGGGAGIQADLKTFAALGCYGTTAITAITAQNTLGVQAIHAVPVSVVEAQIRAVMDDIRPKAIKIGMIATPELALAIGQVLQAYPEVPVVLDPVMVAASGDRLIAEETVAALEEALFPLATLLTPNVDEAALLVNQPITSLEALEQAALQLQKQGCRAVLAKGAHLSGDALSDVFVDPQGAVKHLPTVRIPTANVHGSGCTLSSAIAAYLALGTPLDEAVVAAQAYVHQALRHGSHIRTGQGSGPLNHFFEPIPQKTDELD
jgi:hydroxymethylpyrimidine/phosphomethylpyrimidine kinase